jgi:hypothetical protein
MSKHIIFLNQHNLIVCVDKCFFSAVSKQRMEDVAITFCKPPIVCDL